jgi:predicted nucleic acid-binding protein
MNVIDTNIWIYRHDSRDPRKQSIAKNLVSTLRPLALPWQVGCEFVAAARKLAPLGFDEANAWAALADMQIIAQAVVMPTPQIWLDAKSIQKAHTLSFWDACWSPRAYIGARPYYTRKTWARRGKSRRSL